LEQERLEDILLFCNHGLFTSYAMKLAQLNFLPWLLSEQTDEFSRDSDTLVCSSIAICNVA